MKQVYLIEGVSDAFCTANGCKCVIVNSKTVYGPADTAYEVLDVKIVEPRDESSDYLVGVVVEVFPSNLEEVS